jgi:hypothetical protein
MARGGHGLHKVSPGFAMPNHSMVARPQGGRSAAVFFPLKHPTPYACGNFEALLFAPDLYDPQGDTEGKFNVRPESDLTYFVSMLTYSGDGWRCRGAECGMHRAQRRVIDAGAGESE